MTCILPGNLPVLDAVGFGSGWDPAHLSLIALSNGSRTATATSANIGCVRGVKSQTAGKTYFEITVNATFGLVAAVGVCDGNFNLAGQLQLGNDGGGDSIGLGFNNGASQSDVWYADQQPWSGSVQVVAGNVIGVALDQTGTSTAEPAVGFYINGDLVGLGANFAMLEIIAGTALFPAFSGFVSASRASADQVTINTAGPFSHPPPAGYVAWR
jgi:hypothetical protein